MICLLENPDDENTRALSLKITKIIDAYKGPEDLPQIQLELGAFRKAIHSYRIAD